MEKKYNHKYYLGLDIGTDSVGYAVTDDQYNLLRFRGEDAWGSTLFDAGNLKEERRGHRSDRRRLDRRKQRVKLLQEIFAKEIAKVDERFFIRLEGSYLWREDTADRYTIFEDEDYTDKEYHEEYPTIHHLICDLMEKKEPHDIRQVYLACAWLVGHRGHFLKNIDEKNISGIKEFQNVYDEFKEYFSTNEYSFPWDGADVNAFGDVLKEKTGVTLKTKKLTEVLLQGRKPEKEITEEFPFREDMILKLLAGGKCNLKDLFGREEYAELGSVELSVDDEKLEELAVNLGEDFELIEVLRKLSDWAVLAEILEGVESISQAKKNVYEQHGKDLKKLKYFIKKYCNNKYDEVFRSDTKDNYVSYSYHTRELPADMITQVKKTNVEEFSKYILKILNTKQLEEQLEDEDREAYEDMIRRLGLREFMPKQKNTDNRTIPYQLYFYELNKILENASAYLPFLKEKDESGFSNAEKIQKIFKFKLPYFVGPLNKNSAFSWVERTGEKITPWNYEKVIDFDVSEKNFIERMTNQCSYLPGKSVLPKDSLCYHKFCVLNEINNLKIDGHKIPVEAKQEIYHELFEKKKKVKRKDIEAYLVSNGYLEKNQEDRLSGIDIEVKSNLSTQIAFRRLMENQLLSVQEVEDIIARASYADDKTRVVKYLEENYPKLSKEDIRHIKGIKIKDFGRLSREFLTELEGASKETGEVFSILTALWETNDNLMELLSDRYTFAKEVEEYCREYYSSNKITLEKKLDDMYISNAVRRPIYRTLAVVNDLQKAFGAPKKIFVEMTRGADPSQKGKRTTTRKQQILDLYEKCKDEDIRDLKKQLEALGERVDSKLQGDKLFLYFMQFGRSAYSGSPIVLEELLTGSKEYDIDHIYPQAYVKDDSIINNKVLVFSKENGQKQDKYPIEKVIQNKMSGTWAHWRKIGTISEEKYKRLIRTTPFSNDEKLGFINRQLTETSQSTKAIAELLKARFPEADIIYTKARLTTDFRHEYDLYKVRSYNDLHHAVDAYLNIVTGNVYHMKFTREWFHVDSQYSVKIKTIFKHALTRGDELVWDGEDMLKKVIRTAKKNTAHCTKFAFFKTGGLFDQQPVKKKEGLIPLKKGMDTAKYGGYNKSSVMFFIPVRYTCKKKTEVIFLSVELMHGKHFLEDESFAKEYAYERLKKILKKEVDSLEFPLGMRPVKINTVLSLDGLRVCITGSAAIGKQLIIQTITQFVSDDFWKYYIKKLERFVEKTEKNPSYRYDEEYDVVSCEKNIELYDLYLEKMEQSVYQKRANLPKEKLINGRDKFLSLDVENQSKALMNIHQLFGRSTTGVDLSLIGGDKIGGSPKLSSSVSNWKKYYKDVRIIDVSPSGLWERQSENLLELL